MASAGPYASLHLAPDRHHASSPPLSFYRPDALPAAQPTASKHDGCYANSIIAKNAKKITPDYFTTFIPPVIMITDLSPLN